MISFPKFWIGSRFTASRAARTTLAALILGCWAALASGQPAPPPLVQPELVRTVSAHVHVIPDMSVGSVPNVGIIVGTKAVLVVDTGLGPRNGAAVLAAERRIAGGLPLYIVVTHFHPEHDLGAQALPDATLIRSIDEEKDIAEFGSESVRSFLQRGPIYADLLKDARYRPADIRFGDHYDLDLGGVTVRLIAMGPNHTRGDTAIFVEGDRVLFAGDIVMTAQPAFASPYSSVKHWLASLNRLEALNPMVIVPSHGPIGDKALIAGYRSYLREIAARAATSKSQGLSVEQAIDAIGAEMAPRYKDARRLAGAVRAAYAEAP